MARFNTALTSSIISGTATIGTPYSGAFTEFTGTAPYTVTLPSPVLFPGVNQTFYNGTSGQVTLSVSGALFVGTGASGAATFVLNSGNVVSLFSNGTNYVVISEDGSPLTATTGSFSGNVTINGGSATLSATPQTVTLNPTGASTIDNINIGVTTRGSGAFNTLTANQAVTFTANTASSGTGTGTVVVTGGLGVSGTVYAGAFNGNLTGTVQTAAQPNITSHGALTSLTVSGFTGLGAAPAHTTGVQWQGFTGALELNGGVGSIGATTNGLYLQGNQFWDGSVGWSAHALGASSQMLLGKGSIGATVFASANANAAVGSSLASWNLSNTGFSTTGGNLIHSSANPSAGVNLYIKNTTDTGGDNTRYAGIQFQIGSDVGTAAIQAYRTASAADYSTALTFLTKGTGAPATNPVERMRINALGQVLIGTTSTPYSGAAGSGVYINGVSNNQPDLAALFVAGAKIGFAGIQSLIQNQLVVYDNTAGNPAGSGGAIAFGGNAGGGQGTYYAAIESRKDNGTAGAYGASLNFYTRPDSGYYTSPNMTISSSGKVGIGTDSPTFLTEIVGGTTTVETTLLQIRSNAGGIGTGSTIAFGNSTNPTAGSGRVELAAIRDTASGASFVIRTGDSAGTIQNRVKINESGNVGIGTQSPGAKLHIISTNTITGLKVTSSNDWGNVNAPFIDFDGNANGSGDGNILRVKTGAARSDVEIFEVQNGNGTQFLVRGDGNVGIGVSSLNASGGVLQLKSGITFPATQVASADANTLDDYEEGSFTPIFAASGGTVPATQTGTGAYIKVGRVVHLHGQISWSGSGSAGANLYVSLPFIVVSGARGALALGIISGFNWTAGHQLTLLPELNTTVAYFVSKDPAGGGHIHRTLSDVSTTGSYLFSFAGSYVTSN